VGLDVAIHSKDAPVAVHIVLSTDAPSDCGVLVIAPAVANPLFRLTGKPYRSLSARIFAMNGRRHF